MADGPPPTRRKAAPAVFAGLDRQNRYAVLYRIHTTKTPKARAHKIARLVDDLARGVLPYPKNC